MTVRRKLLLITFSSLIGFVLAFAVVLAGYFRLQSARRLETAAFEAAGGWNRLNITLKDSLLKNESVSSSARGAEQAIDSFAEVFDRFLTLEDDPIVSEDQAKNMELLRELWDMSETSYREIVDLMDTLVGKGIDTQVSSRGLMRYYGESLVSRETGDKGIWEIQRINDLQKKTGFANETFVKNLDTFLSDARAASRRATTSLFALAGVILVASVVLALILLGGFNRRLVGKIRSVEEVMSKLASQDLTSRAETGGSDELAELGRHVNRTVEGLTGFLEQVKLATSRVSETKEVVSTGTTESSAALEEISKNIEFIKGQLDLLNADIQQSGLAVHEIDDVVRDLFDQINSQSSSIESSSGSIGRISETIDQVSSRTRKNRENAGLLHQSVARGGEEVEQSVSIVEEIADDISDIKEILDIIQGISDQTNLLSMNAAIESAHAGDAGRGFAVVAEEIRNLSNTTAENTQRVGAVLGRVVERIERAKSAGSDTLEAFQVIRSVVEDLSASAEQIAVAMEDLTSGSSVLRKETEEIGEITGRITRGAKIMKDRSAELTRTLAGVSQVSEGVLGGTDEIDAGAKEILESMVHIKDTAEDARRDMDVLDSLMAEFTMETPESQA